MQIGLRQHGGNLQAVAGTIVDFSDSGVGVLTRTSLQVGDLVTLWGAFFKNNGSRPEQSARVVYCRTYDGGAFRAGVYLHQGRPRQDRGRNWCAAFRRFVRRLLRSFAGQPETPPSRRSSAFIAWWRTSTTPTTKETGHADAFQLLLNAYQVLSDPEKRAKYDAVLPRQPHQAAGKSSTTARRRKVWKPSKENDGGCSPSCTGSEWKIQSTRV